MSVSLDRQTKSYITFLLFTLVLAAVSCLFLYCHQNQSLKDTLLAHDQAVLSRLLEAGVPADLAAGAITSTVSTPEGISLMAKIGLTGEIPVGAYPALTRFSRSLRISMALFLTGLALFLTAGTGMFLYGRECLYRQAVHTVRAFISGDFSTHLPRAEEGTLYHLFSFVDNLANTLRTRNETEHQAKEFLKDTVSDISHQLKTPLAALNMYNEIISGEPDHPETVTLFSRKTRYSLDRMEQLIGSLLKITRLDSGTVLFEKDLYPVHELVSKAVQDLRTRAELEKKELLIRGGAQQIFCDAHWTCEAIGNLVKNALDHTDAGGRICITWESSPAMVRILVTDDGAGIDPEDFHHIFKRFYRSRHSLDTSGTGLGLPLAKSIIEGQGGILSVQSTPGNGATFFLSFLTKP